MLRTAGEGHAYEVIARDLRNAIAGGDFDDGRRLPTEVDLSKRYGVSRQTVRHAFHQLVTERVVTRTAGRGTFVNPRPSGYARELGSIDQIMELATDTSREVLLPFRAIVDIEAASRLRLGSDLVHVAEMRRWHESVPFVISKVYLPGQYAALVAGLPELQHGVTSTRTVIGLLEPMLEEPVAEVVQSITVAKANLGMAEALACEPDTILLRVDRLFMTKTGEPVELTINHFRADFYTYRVTLHRGRGGI